MIMTQRTQSLSEFRKTAAETIERINKTGEAEILDGEWRGESDSDFAGGL